MFLNTPPAKAFATRRQDRGPLPADLFDIAVLGDAPSRINEVLQAIGSVASYKLINVLSPPPKLDFTSRVDVVNIDMLSMPSVSSLRAVLGQMGHSARARIVMLNTASHREVTQGHALGATELIGRPIDAMRLMNRVSSNLTGPVPQRPPLGAGAPEVAAYTTSVLREMMISAVAARPMGLHALNLVGDVVVTSVAERSLAEWIKTVRQSHSQTYEHSVLVTVIAVAFGLNLGFSHSDLLKVATSGLVHDTGKAFVPLEILEKPGALDPAELAWVQLHPKLGHDALKRSGAEPHLLDVALNHHEFLDGSGYPHGLPAHRISDLVRVITIADIFGALIERRAYKAPIPAMKAYDMLVELGPKLDMPLVRAFRPVAEQIVNPKTRVYI